MSNNFFALVLLLFFSVQITAQNNIDADIQKLEVFLKSLDKRYVDSVETSKLVEKAISAMLEELDPHSVYMDQDRYQRANEALHGEFVGIGIRYRMLSDTMLITEVFEKSPSKRAGIYVGDRVVSINGDTVAGREMNENEITDRIKGEDNTTVKMSLQRWNGEKVITTLQRDKIHTSTVEVVKMLDKSNGYIKLNRFGARSYTEFKRALDDLNDQGMENLVIDLRGNSGGYLNVAIKIADEFLDDRKMIVFTEGLHQSRKELMATSGGRFLEGKVAILMDESSASASEILAGALQDWDRALIVGRRSYGKGLVQRTVEFDDGSAMRLTISRYYTPTGRSIQKPFNGDLEAYKDDIQARHDRGELYVRDSMQLDLDHVYMTPANRKVYGGGGIVPDVFVPIDTLKYSEYVYELIEKGVMDGFTIDYTMTNIRSFNKEYKNAQKFVEEFTVNPELLEQLKSYGEKRGVLCDESIDMAKADQELNKYLKAHIAKYLFDSMAFYQSLAPEDEMIMAAIQNLDDQMLKELGLK